MKLLVNDKELARFLFSLMDNLSSCKDIQYTQSATSTIINDFIEKRAGRKYKPEKDNLKFKEGLQKAVARDLRDYFGLVKSHLKNRETKYFSLIHTRLDYFLNRLGKEQTLANYKASRNRNFVKTVGFHISPTSNIIRRVDFKNVKEDCLLRNTVGNEQLLISKIDNQYPFWFIDSGYTNFLETNKHWHRLVHNHIHSFSMFDAPVDRLSNFKSFPQQWRSNGDKILVIEPGPFAAAISHIDIAKWKYNVEKELRQYTDKKIVFREKFPKKTRPNLYKHLCNEDYHCIVHVNSNAATEAIWAGVPVITLDKHITSPVSSNSISQVNSLVKPNLAAWLAVLSYSQFTYNELMDGTAVEIVRKYHG